jgi:hypothetical protein
MIKTFKICFDILSVPIKVAANSTTCMGIKKVGKD